MIICGWWLTSVFQSSCCLCNFNIFSYHISFFLWPSPELHLWIMKVVLIGTIRNKVLLRLHVSQSLWWLSEQEFQIVPFFRCGPVISNSSGYITGLELLREVLYLLFPSYSLWGCRTSRSGDCVSVLSTSQTAHLAPHQQSSGLVFWAADLFQPGVLLKLQVLP